MSKRYHPDERGRFGMKRSTKRKLKILVGVAAGVVLVSGALLIWAGIALVNSIGDMAGNAHFEREWAELQKVEAPLTATAVGALAQSTQCWNEAVRLFDGDMLLQKPLAQHFDNLSRICLQGQMPEATGSGWGKDPLETDGESI